MEIMHTHSQWVHWGIMEGSTEGLKRGLNTKYKHIVLLRLFFCIREIFFKDCKIALLGETTIKVYKNHYFKK